MQVLAQQHTITFLEQQLAIAHQQNERLMARLFGGTPAAPAPVARAPLHTIDFAPPPGADPFGGMLHSGVPLPVPPPKGQDAPRAPSHEDVLATYAGEHGRALFADVGDEEANRLGLSHDPVSGSVQQGKRQPLQ